MANKTLYTIGFVFLFWQFLCTMECDAQTKSRNLNWGVRLGLNAISIKSYNASSADEILPNSSFVNKNGYLITVFARYNLNRFFLQPELSWNEYNRTCSFPLPFENNEGYSQPFDLDIKSKVINTNFLAGYNIVYDNTFLFGIYTGFSLNGTYRNYYSTKLEPDESFVNKEFSLNFTGILGLSINISKIYFDLRYEMGLPENLSLKEIPDFPERFQNVKLKLTESILSFSCGIMF
jgi:hypothetical protein